MLSLPCGWVCALVGLPQMFGYIVCGVLLGPSGLNSIKVKLFDSCSPGLDSVLQHSSCPRLLLQSMVQVETLGEIGVFFTLFVVGLEFSPERLHKVKYCFFLLPLMFF